MQTIEQKLAEVKEWINDLSKSHEELYWHVFYDKSRSINSKNSPKESSDTDPERDAEESLELLERSIIRTAKNGHKYILVAVRFYNNGSKFHEMMFPNPLYKENSLTTQTPQKSGNMNLDSLALLKGVMEIVQTQNSSKISGFNELAEMKAEMRELKAEIKHKEEIRHLEDKIAYLENQANGGILGKILSPKNLPAIAAIFNIDLSEEEEEEEEEVKEVQEPQNTHKTDTSQEELMDNWKRDLERIKKVFPNVPKFINKLANYIEKNPKQSKTFLNQLESM